MTEIEMRGGGLIVGLSSFSAVPLRSPWWGCKRGGGGTAQQGPFLHPFICVYSCSCHQIFKRLSVCVWGLAGRHTLRLAPSLAAILRFVAADASLLRCFCGTSVGQIPPLISPASTFLCPSLSQPSLTPPVYLPVSWLPTHFSVHAVSLCTFLFLFPLFVLLYNCTSVCQEWETWQCPTPSAVTCLTSWWGLVSPGPWRLWLSTTALM